MPAELRPPTARHPCRCAPRAPQGSWSIGIFKGRSPLELQPLERYEPRQDSSAAWPVANPVLTCASVGDAPSNFGAPGAGAEGALPARARVGGSSCSSVAEALALQPRGQSACWAGAADGEPGC